MTHIITSLCLRDSGCVDVCPVECIVPGKPQEEWPWYYIDPDTCIDCGACIPECPFEAIFTEDDTPSAFTVPQPVEVEPGVWKFKYLNRIDFTGMATYDGHDTQHRPVHLETVRELQPGEVVDL